MGKRVLIHGADPTLLDTRHRLLSRSGFAVESVLNGSILAELIQMKRPDLLVICSSLTVDSQQRDIRAAYALRPKVKCLVIQPSLHSGQISDADNVFFAFDGPERFVAEVSKMLDEELPA